MPEPLIRRAGSADAETLAAIGAETFVETFGHLYPPDDLAVFLREAYNPARTRADLADPAKASWLVEADGAAIGYALAGPCGLPHSDITPECGELKRIYMRKSWQGGGLGVRLFAETLAWLQAEGRPTVWLGVWSENHGAQRFYERQGFAKVGEYGFAVGSIVDREYIFRRAENRFTDSTVKSASNEHNPA
jgi:GNAT superfamily N-acetyltransferase